MRKMILIAMAGTRFKMPGAVEETPMTHAVEQVEALRPCPFCGADAEMREGQKGQAGCFEPIFKAECSDCLTCAYNWHDTEAEAIAAWNTRPGEAQAERAALERAAEVDGQELAAWQAFDATDCSDRHIFEAGWDAAIKAIRALIPEEKSDD